MGEAKRRLAAILSADAAGYSRLMGDDERATMDTLNAYRQVFRAHIGRHEGRVVDTAGDSVLAVFDSVVEAVECATNVQAELDTRNAELAESRRMRFRIGVNLGDVFEQTDGTIYGDGVNVAARLESLAEPGAVCISESAHMQIVGKTDLSFDDVGEHEVKNIARPVRAYRARHGEISSIAEVNPTIKLSDKPSIAVLPFDNLSGDPEQEYFVDGIAEDLITALSRMRWLSVIARNSTFSYKGQSPDIRNVGQELDVRYVLEGSVRKGGNRIRISAQLIDAADGSHIWAERYDRELADMFDLQDEITLTIAGAIEPELAQSERERAQRKPAENLDAWEICQRAIWHMWRFNKDDNAGAQRLYGQAVAIDPRFATAYANLAYSHFMDNAFGYSDSPRDSVALAEEAAKQAIALDDKDAMAHCTLGRTLTAKGDYPAAIAELRTALDLNPSFALAHFGLGLALQHLGQIAEAIEAHRTAARLSPHDPYMWLFEAVCAGALVAHGRFEEAERLGRSALRRPGVGFWAYASLAAALGHLGRIDEAKPVVAKLLELRPDFSPEFYDRTWPNVQTEFLSVYFDGLRKAGVTSFDT